jgi:hypothetical protein
VATGVGFSGDFPAPYKSPKSIMLPNEEFALACLRYYEEQGIVVDATNGQFAHCPLPRKMGDKGYYLLWEHHQHQGLLQSVDVGRCCFFGPAVLKWLKECDYWPDNYFELWDIYEEFEASFRRLSHTPEVIEKRIKTWREKGYTSAHLRDSDVRKRAAQSMRDFWNSEEGMRKRQIIRNRRAPRARTIEIEFVNGRVGTYSCVKLAALALGVAPTTVSRWISGSNSPQGRHKGLKVRETEPPTA